MEWDQDAHELAARFFRGLGDATRMHILEVLLQGDKNVGELVLRLGSPQGRVSSHLACLRNCGLAVSYRQGKNVFYRVADPRVRRLLDLGWQLVARNSRGITACPVVK